MSPSTLNAGLFAAGLLGLYLGADWLVRGAGRLARRLDVAALVVGLTVVAFGTSAPELVVGLMAASRGEATLALGNVLGSNVVNIALILGASAMFVPIRVGARVIRREIPVMILLTVVLGGLGVNAVLGRGDGALLLLLFFAYLWLVLRQAGHEDPAIEAEYRAFDRPGVAPPGGRGTASSVFLVAVGIVVMLAGARALVDSAVFFARTFGVPDLVIGATVVAIGTSLPELATSLLAAYRGKSDIAVGNIVGSNIFNVCAILGACAVVSPIPFPRQVLRAEYAAMLVVSLALLPLAWSRGTLSRKEGFFLVGLYLAFTILVVLRAG